jgi:hypothetical protein
MCPNLWARHTQPAARLTALAHGVSRACSLRRLATASCRLGKWDMVILLGLTMLVVRAPQNPAWSSSSAGLRACTAGDKSTGRVDSE